jgi:hypothetical protein
MRDLRFYITSNLGGGGQTVSRLFNYLEVLNKINSDYINILLNFRYLKYYKESPPYYKYTPVFSGEIIENLDKSKDEISTFISNKNNFDYLETQNEDELTKDVSVLLDSGAGALIRNLLSKKEYSRDSVVSYFEELVEYHINYLEDKKPNYAIALDYCDKNTYKDLQGKNPNISNIVNELITNKDKQLNLLEKSLKLSSEKNISTKLYAPLHGESEGEIVNNYKNIINIENQLGLKFHGVALGGLRQFSSKSNGNSLIGNIIARVKEIEPNKKIHVLGSSGLQRIIPFVYAGADSFDCHTYWRRANDGSRTASTESKIVVPLLNSDKQLVEYKEDSFKNINLVDVDINLWPCDCFVCKDFGILNLLNLYSNSKNTEEYYFAKILIYFHSVYQYQFLFDKLHNMENSEILNFVNSLKNTKYTVKLKENLEEITI